MGKKTQIRALPAASLRRHPLNGRIYMDGDLSDLTASIARHGILEPLVATPRRVIISGHRRHAAALALGLRTVPVEVRAFDDEATAIVEFNRQRTKTWSERYRELRAILPALRSAATRRRLDGARRGAAARHGLPGAHLGTRHGRCKVYDEAAVLTGLSRERVRKLIRVYEACESGAADRRVIERLDAGEISVHRAYLAVVRSRLLNARRAAMRTQLALEEDLAEMLRPFDLWAFGKRDRRFDAGPADDGGSALPHAVPGQVWVNLLYFFTAPGDLVVDVTAGSGTLHRVAAWMGRRCLSFDLRPMRPQIARHDITRGFPDLDGESPDLVVLDPPFGAQRRYSGYRADLSSCGTQARYLRLLERAITACLGALRRGGRLAVVMGNGRRRGWTTDLCWEAARIIARHGRLERRIQVPYAHSHFPDYAVARARRRRELLCLTREVLIAAPLMEAPPKGE
jgi:hypothetical protein